MLFYSPVLISGVRLFSYAVKLAYYRKPKEACQYFDLGDSSQTYRVNLASGIHIAGVK